jgi:hypothetical protein
VTDRRVTTKHWAGFAENASPEAIEIHLRWAQTERRSIDRYITKLETLLERRTAEKAAGTWPATGLEDLTQDRDPHAGCWQPHLGPDGPEDCNGRPL